MCKIYQGEITIKKYEVIKIYLEDEWIGLKIGDIIELKKMIDDEFVLGKLPKRLHGKGYTASKYRYGNYWLFLLTQLKEIK